MKKNLKKMHFIRFGVIVASLALFTLTSCKDTANIEDYVGVHKTDPYDPSKPVTITSFTPESGGLGQQIVINGSNFGNDVDKVSITIGGENFKHAIADVHWWKTFRSRQCHERLSLLLCAWWSVHRCH